LGRTPDPISPLWQAFAGPLERLKSHSERVNWAVAYLKTAPEETVPSNQHVFGSFRCEPTASSVVRIHFVNSDTDMVSPLAASKLELRQNELKALVSFLKTYYPSARAIAGASWLYHLDAYKRLFPKEYILSVRPIDRASLIGMSTWGQFLRHDGRIKPNLWDQCIRLLDNIPKDKPWLVFPLQPLTTSAPVESFYRHYLP
jgi:hypothetical protein